MENKCVPIRANDFKFDQVARNENKTDRDLESSEAKDLSAPVKYKAVRAKSFR